MGCEEMGNGVISENFDKLAKFCIVNYDNWAYLRCVYYDKSASVSKVGLVRANIYAR